MRRLYFLLILGLLFSMAACSKEENIENIEAERSIDIKAQEGISNQFGIYVGTTEFAVNIPKPGTYHLKYLLETVTGAKKHTTDDDTVDLIFGVQDSALIFIGIDTLEKVQDATLSSVSILTPAEELQGNQISESVTIYYDTSDIIPWDSIAQDSGASEIILIENGNTVPDSEVILFEEDDVYPICSGEHTLTNSHNVFACQLGGGTRTLESGGWYWIRMSIGFETENGEEEARAQKPDITLPVTMDGVSMTMVDSTIVEYNDLAGFWEVNAYYCTGRLEAGTYTIVGESYNKGEFVDRAVCELIVE